MRDNKAEIVVAGLGCIMALVYVTFWGAVIWVAIHFIKRLW